MNETEEILKRNVRDLQNQLRNSYIKNKELTEEIRKLSKLINLLLGKPDDKNKRKN
tara:strand:+ start:281 stop:448 length:168 start_codon:yes stop_codon:yes gene_type:complete